jgi:dihydrofolate synthase/folylpolyglutamate synthase
MDYSQAIAYLHSLGNEVLAAKLGLERVRLLLEKLDNPDRSFRSVIIAGTNGKGSTAAFIESILRAAGIRAGLYTSPHLIRMEERIRVNGKDAESDQFARLVFEVRQAAEDLVASGELDAPPTFFEHLTLMAMLHFRQQGVELAVLEVGLGGRLDATNVVEPLVSVVTTIGLDHQDILGAELTQIASEKAAVIKPGGRAVIGHQDYRDASDVIMQRCLDVGVLPVFASDPTNVRVSPQGQTLFDYQSAGSDYRDIQPGLRGRYQMHNAAAAIEIAEMLSSLGWRIGPQAIAEGIRNVTWPGRLELIQGRPAMLLDGAHNPDGARRLRQYLEEFSQAPITLVFGAMSDKDVDKMASELFGLARTLVLTRVRDRRAATTARLGGPALELSRSVIFTESVRQAISWARSMTSTDGLICVAGSLHLIGEVKSLLDQEDDQRRWI